ncbi:MAG: tetratricopeptide repeat protein [Nitrospirae bacterium]|nr:tetratricopeptide repeat protein [Nitrospirota bacterium]
MTIARQTEPMKLIAHIFILFFLMLTVSCATFSTDSAIQNSAARYKIGVGYYGEGKIQQAFVEFQHAYELNPRNKEAIYAIGIIYLLDFDENEMAIDFFQRAVKIDPDYSDAYNNLGFAYAKVGKFDAAIPFYKKAVSNLFYATPEKAFVNMGKAYYRLGRYDEAATAYKEAIKRSPNFDLPYLGLALCNNATGKYGDASAALSRAIVLNPQYKGNAKIAAEDFLIRKLGASNSDQKDFSDYLEILKY